MDHDDGLFVQFVSVCLIFWLQSNQSKINNNDDDDWEIFQFFLRKFPDKHNDARRNLFTVKQIQTNTETENMEPSRKSIDANQSINLVSDLC